MHMEIERSFLLIIFSGLFNPAMPHFHFDTRHQNNIESPLHFIVQGAFCVCVQFLYVILHNGIAVDMVKTYYFGWVIE